MPKILITGNGFDLSFGLPTSYNEFINILNSLNSYEEPNFDTIYSHSNNFEKLSEYYKKFDFDLEKTELLRQNIQDNLWFQFFKNELEIETWIDFENKIEYVLNILFSSINYIKENIFSKGSLSEDNITYNTKLFNNDIEIIQVLNSFNIISVDKDYTITLNLDYFIKKYDFYINVDISAITKILTEELNVFKRIFNLYFEVFVFPFYDNPKKRFDRTLFSTISKHYTFNYTPTFEKIYKRINKTKFLHGKIDSLSNEIVLGINEIPNDDLDKRFFLPFTKYFQKLNNSTDFEFIGEYEKRKNSNFYFFFFGHSLDSSDADYINEVFDFINQSKSRKKKIIVIYHSKKSKSQLLINLLNIRGKKDIQSLMRNKILDFQHIESKELKTELKRDISSSTRVSVV
ncbi:AbiH family protein [Winogradskyella helgolandensis]|uniref:AbiH family protein n=1 Tax=Winogradskyella helgolandensis TaxID=2697010 RepID=UPI0015CD6AB2|nr:AbiH family protein [Winogradskyella helgolandensis]